jgi:actin-related protein 5
MLIAGAAGTVEEAETEGNSKNKKQKLKRPAEAKKKAPPAKKKKDKDRDEDDDEDVNMGEEIIEDDDEDDNFGANDEDWLVYREMSRDLSSDEEEEDAQRLKQLQRDIEALDESQRKPQISEAEWNQIRLTTERGAVGEVCFSPVSILGVDCAGLVETITRYVLPHYPSEVQYEMLSHVYVYGGNTKLDGFCDRLQMDLQSYMPYDKVQVRTFPAEDPLNDSWRGASALWTHNGQYHQASQPVVRRWEEQTGWITRAMYDEMGHGYLNEHAASNVFVPTPVAPTM